MGLLSVSSVLSGKQCILVSEDKMRNENHHVFGFWKDSLLNNYTEVHMASPFSYDNWQEIRSHTKYWCWVPMKILMISAADVVTHGLLLLALEPNMSWDISVGRGGHIWKVSSSQMISCSAADLNKGKYSIRCCQQYYCESIWANRA